MEHKDFALPFAYILFIYLQEKQNLNSYLEILFLWIFVKIIDARKLNKYQRLTYS